MNLDANGSMISVRPPHSSKPKAVLLPTIIVDSGSDLIRVVPRQFHSPDELAAHFNRLQAAIAATRHRGRIVKVIVDLRGVSVLSPEGARKVQMANATPYRPEDRIALVITSVLPRLQARRVIDQTGVGIFETMADAEAWVEALATR